MRYEIVVMEELGVSEWTRWREIQRSTPQLASPYFCPEFARCVAEVREDVRICVLEDDGVCVGFFPFQLRSLGVGVPLGGVVSDYHGIVAPMDLRCDTPKMLEKCRLLTWEFDHLVAEQEAFAPHHLGQAISPAIDVSRGFDAYVEELRRAGSSRVSQLRRKARKLEREVGPIRFEAHVDDPAVLRTVIQWKSEQCRRTGAPDFFVQQPWTRALMSRIWCTETEHFRGLLSVLWSGDELMAAHLGMRSDRALHWWFPVYNRAFGIHSPGALLLLRVAELAASLGIAVVDLGKGDDPYKRTFANTHTRLAEGFAASHRWIAGVEHARASTRRWLRASSAPLRPAWRALRRLMQPQDAFSLTNAGATLGQASGTPTSRRRPNSSC
jgi:CelD/BcsL family acetyltransferase involved in cellulose biosynthesis